MNLKKLVHDYHERRAAEDSKPLPAVALPFIPPDTVRKATWRQPGYGLLFCVHGKSYFEPCAATTCRRNKKEADQRLAAFISSIQQDRQK